MKKLISVPVASLFILFAMSVMIIFHIFILAGVVPFQNVWGGRLKNQDEMIMFESFAICISLLMMAVPAIRAGYLSINVSQRILTICLAVMGVFFLLNSLGNVASSSNWERLIFTPVTLLLSASCFFLAFTKRPSR